VKDKMHTKLVDPAELGAWISGVIALLMHYSGSYTLPPEALGVMLTAALLPLAMGVIRFVNRVTSEVPSDNPPADEAGFASVALMTFVAVLCLILMATFGGCGSSYHLATGGWNLDRADCGTKLTVYGDGDPEVSVICIKDPAPLKVGPKVRAALCAGK
tara:strand:- start:2054 stop:2530 length:477 start_codon:yes stop_codon:yes gene_type:complete